jgi:hypothetical protein
MVRTVRATVEKVDFRKDKMVAVTSEGDSLILFVSLREGIVEPAEVAPGTRIKVYVRSGHTIPNWRVDRD